MNTLQEKEANEAKKKRDTIRMEKLKEEDPERYAEMTRKAPEKQRERQRRKYKIKFDEPQPCPHCAKMFEFKYAMAVSVCKVKGRISLATMNGTMPIKPACKLDLCISKFAMPYPCSTYQF